MTFIKGKAPPNTGRTHIKKGQHLSIKTEFKKGVSTWNKDKKLAPEHIAKLKGKRPNASGEKNHNWKDGATPINTLLRKSLEYKLWREAVFKRDNYTCIWCGGESHGDIEADHIKSFAYFPELRFAIDNGRTLCRKCHKTTDTYLYKAKLKYGN